MMTNLRGPYRLSLLADTYQFWQCSNLEYLPIKETQLATIISLLISRDITNKLYAMNVKVVTEKVSHLDIHLPRVPGSMMYRSPLPFPSEEKTEMFAYKFIQV